MKKYAGITPVHPDLHFELDVDEVLDYIYFVDPQTLEILEDDDEDYEDEYVSNPDDEYYGYGDDDEEEDEDEDEDEEEPAVVHRIVDFSVGGRVRKNMALVQLNPADDCEAWQPL